MQKNQEQPYLSSGNGNNVISLGHILLAGRQILLRLRLFIRHRCHKLRLVPKRILLLNFFALLLLSQQTHNLLELVVLPSVSAELGLQRAYGIDRTIVLDC